MRDDALSALDRLERDAEQIKRDVAELRRALAGERVIEKPISIKIAAHRAGYSEKAVQRLARRLAPEGGAMKISGAWHIYESCLVRSDRSGN